MSERLRWIRAYARPLSVATALIVLITGVVVLRQGGDATRTGTGTNAPDTSEGGIFEERRDDGDGDGGAGSEASSSDPSSPGGTTSGTVTVQKPGTSAPAPKAGTIIPGKGLVPPGVTNKEIHVAYYWKGDRTRTSPYLHGSGVEGNVDEAESFRALVEYINKHSGDGSKIMGFPFDLHGRKIKGTVIEAGTDAEDYAATAQTLTKETRPMTAISSHGSLSAYICPTLAKNNIHNISTYDLGGKGGSLQQRTNGYCMPSGMSWERQVERTIAYLKKHKSTTYTGTEGGPKRIYGFVYAEYPGLIDAAPLVVKQMKAAGIPVAVTESMSADLTTAQGQVPGIIGALREKDVNTLIFPDSGAPLNFTHTAAANGYKPDYYVWPCSGQDTAGMVRLFDPVQWERAEGLTCYDYEFNPDLTNDDRAAQSEWWKQYQEIRGNNEPPAPTPLVYQSLWQLLVGITNAGPTLTVETFRSGLSQFKPYRYDAITGKTTDATNMMLSINESDRSPVNDVAKLYWDNTKRTSGNKAQGFYVYPEKRRYIRGSSF